jgi:LmbE family N-acetylglucosaminyl deacetylase
MANPMRASLIAVAAALSVAVISAQLRIRPVDLEDGAVALGLALRRLNTTAVFMQMTAHPDDENNALHVYFNRGLGMRTVLATATRGDGGQNEIGPELADPLAVLRTGELEAMHRFDSTEQYFTRAVDFGYSFSIEETMEKWGRDEIVGDYARLIRMTRPDVIVAMNPTGTAGGLHHQASGLLSREAFKAAGDASRYPDQIRDGLLPWQPRKFYFTFGGPGGGGPAQALSGGPLPLGALNLASFDVSGFDAILGRTYSEVGTEERGMHKSQAMAPLLALPTGRTQVRYLLMDSFAAPVQGEETSIFRGVDTTIPGLAAMAGATPPPALVAGLREIADRATAAQKQFDLDGSFASAPEIPRGPEGRAGVEGSALHAGAHSGGTLQPRFQTQDERRPVHRGGRARTWPARRSAGRRWARRERAGGAHDDCDRRSRPSRVADVDCLRRFFGNGELSGGLDRTRRSLPL